VNEDAVENVPISEFETLPAHFPYVDPEVQQEGSFWMTRCRSVELGD
jgi:hypothetical protein